MGEFHSQPRLDVLEGGVELANRKNWKRFAVVTDVDWVARAIRMFTWAMPGELGVYEDLGNLERAKTWVTE